jgi:hypothetical protein
VVKEYRRRAQVFSTKEDDRRRETATAKIGRDNDGKPGGCSNVRITIGLGGPPATIWTSPIDS